VIGARALEGKPIAALSVAMPILGSLWLLAIARRVALVPEAVEINAATDRPSRRPPKRDSRTSPVPNQGDSAPNRHASA
ncbi:MAG TPA: hypothetical protein VEQ59_04165, partial [Polyangiaceae bacterium]|nr:hypothetical protein [Polyangiaceae bacterium]